MVIVHFSKLLLFSDKKKLPLTLKCKSFPELLVKSA